MSSQLSTITFCWFILHWYHMLSNCGKGTCQYCDSDAPLCTLAPGCHTGTHSLVHLFCTLHTIYAEGSVPSTFDTGTHSLVHLFCTLHTIYAEGSVPSTFDTDTHSLVHLFCTLHTIYVEGSLPPLMTQTLTHWFTDRW